MKNITKNITLLITLIIIMSCVSLGSIPNLPKECKLNTEKCTEDNKNANYLFGTELYLKLENAKEKNCKFELEKLPSPELATDWDTDKRNLELFRNWNLRNLEVFKRIKVQCENWLN